MKVIKIILRTYVPIENINGLIISLLRPVQHQTEATIDGLTEPDSYCKTYLTYSIDIEFE